MKRNFENVTKIVVKVGTSVITKQDGTLDDRCMQDVARQCCAIMKEGRRVTVVTSGAIGSGVKELGLKELPRDIPTRQGAAAVGQSILMEEWRKSFRKFGSRVAQILLTYEAFSNRRTYVNLRNSMTVLTKRGTVPIINENDPISVHEIEATFGDNDKLSALIAANTDADLLILLTDVDGLYDKDPRHKGARLIRYVTGVSPSIERVAGEASSWRTKGGMKAKIEAAKIVTKSNCSMIIANAREKDVLTRVLNGEEIGTLFIPRKAGYTNRERWIRFSKSHGTIAIDGRAKDALVGGASLLASGIRKVEGEFDSGCIVSLVHWGHEIARGIVEYSSEELNKIKGRRTDQIEAILGYKSSDSAINEGNIVLS
ncbi:MAG TPA: glutamate 5-kinase [Candidatus Acidoferrum sp.]|nr:glutamate 5-kinase [Candidatus Acidoferrum sp.]